MKNIKETKKEYWINRENQKVDISTMSTEYLMNCINFVERKAIEGVGCYMNIGSDTDSYYAVYVPTTTIFGEDVKEHYNYKALLKELKERN